MACVFDQSVIPLDLTTSSTDQFGPEGIHIRAEQYNSYAAMFSDVAVVTARFGGLGAVGYNLYSLPTRRNRAPYGDIYLEWDAQAGITLTLILGIDEDIGVR